MTKMDWEEIRMKKAIFRTAVLAAAVSTMICGCEKTYEFSHGIGFISEYNVLSTDAGSTPVLVFSNTDWTAAFDTQVDWAYLDRLSGTGDGYVKFVYEQNYGRSRAVTIVAGGGGETATLRMWQKPAISDDNVVMTLGELTEEVSAAAGEKTVSLSTNLVYQVSEFSNEVIYDDEESAGWISDVCVVDDPARKGNCSVTFRVAANKGTEDRTARICVTHTDGGGAYDSLVGTTLRSNYLIVTQKHE